MISIVVAYSNNRVIGKDNKMPWDIKGDLEFFKNLTMGNIIVMGRRTYESIGRTLPGRINIVISRRDEKSNEQREENLYLAKSLEEAIFIAKTIITNNKLEQDIKKNNSNSSYEEDKIKKEQEFNLSQSLGDEIYVSEVFEENKGIKENKICYNNKIKSNDEIKQEINHAQSSQDDIYTAQSLIKEKDIENINSNTMTKIQPKEIFIIGGESIYEQSIDIADRIYVTKINFDYDGDKYFPYFDEDKYRTKILKSEDLPVRHSFILYEKI